MEISYGQFATAWDDRHVDVSATWEHNKFSNLYAYDQASIAFDGNVELDAINLLDNSTLSMGFGAELGTLRLFDSARARIDSPQQIRVLHSRDSSVVEINQGDVPHIQAFGQSRVDLRNTVTAGLSRATTAAFISVMWN